MCLYIFTVSPQSGFGVHVKTGGTPLLERGSIVTIHWHPSSFLPFIDTTKFDVGITLRLLDPHTQLFDHSVTLASALANTGEANITIPSTLPLRRNSYPLHPVAIEVGMNSVDLQPFSLEACSHTNTGCEGARVAKHSSVLLLDLTSSEFERSERCKEWANNQSSEVTHTLRTTLPPCPCTEESAALPNSGFKIESLSHLSSSDPASNVQRNTHYEGREFEESYQNLLHRNASICYQQQ